MIPNKRILWHHVAEELNNLHNQGVIESWVCAETKYSTSHAGDMVRVYVSEDHTEYIICESVLLHVLNSGYVLGDSDRYPDVDLVETIQRYGSPLYYVAANGVLKV